jgi:hypothetical protein
MPSLLSSITLTLVHPKARWIDESSTRPWQKEAKDESIMQHVQPDTQAYSKHRLRAHRQSALRARQAMGICRIFLQSELISKA